MSMSSGSGSQTPRVTAPRPSLHSNGQQQQQQQQQHQQQQQQQPAQHTIPSHTPGGGPLAAAARPSESEMAMATRIPNILPHERVFPIQIGSELFKLSGASLSSDAPSYFSQHFQCQLKTAEQQGVEEASAAIRTLYIDRDPVTFRDISLHLQGYHVQPRDGTHFVRLFADAQFYSLPRLISQLYEESIFMSIGHREFQIPRDLFEAPGNTPNYFSLGFAVFFSSPDDLFPGLDREGLIRPPSILPPQAPGRSADTFEELLHLLRGYPVHIRNETHRQTLLRDCRYFNFKGLEQKLIPHALSYNQARQRREIALRLEDVLKSGISVAGDATLAVRTPAQTQTPTRDPRLAGWVNYARPFVDEKPAELVLEIGGEDGGEDMRLHFGATRRRGHVAVGAELFRDTRTRVARLLEVVATKLNLPPTTQPLGRLMAQGGASSCPPTPGNTPLSDDLVCVVFGPDTAITLDGVPLASPPAVANDLCEGGDTVDAVAADGVDAADGADLADMAAIADTADAADTNASRKRRRGDDAASGLGGGASSSIHVAAGTTWVVRRGLWRLRIRPSYGGRRAAQCVFVGVKLDAMSSELARNQQRGFLGS